MADLPDIDTSTVSTLAYWNAIDDGGVGSIDPEEVTSSGAIVDYTLYDNGLEGTFDLLATTEVANDNDDPYTATFRVKSDGWMVVYLSDRENYATKLDLSGEDDGSYIKEAGGWWDFACWFDNYGSTSSGFLGTYPDAQNSNIAQAIDLLRQEFSNSGSMSYSAGAVGLYNYQYNSATTITLLSQAWGDNASGQAGWSYTSSTNLHSVVATGVCDSYPTLLDFEGIKLVYDEDSSVGSLDCLAEGLVPNSGTEYQHAGDTQNYGWTIGSTYAAWS